MAVMTSAQKFELDTAIAVLRTHLRRLTAGECVAAISAIADGYCLHCGDETHGRTCQCQCQNDE